MSFGLGLSFGFTFRFGLFDGALRLLMWPLTGVALVAVTKLLPVEAIALPFSIGCKRTFRLLPHSEYTNDSRLSTNL